MSNDPDVLAAEIRKLSTRDKITMARDLIDAPASKMNEATKRQLVANLLRMALAEVQS